MLDSKIQMLRKQHLFPFDRAQERKGMGEGQDRLARHGMLAALLILLTGRSNFSFFGLHFCWLCGTYVHLWMLLTLAAARRLVKLDSTGARLTAGTTSSSYAGNSIVGNRSLGATFTARELYIRILYSTSA